MKFEQTNLFEFFGQEQPSHISAQKQTPKKLLFVDSDVLRVKKYFQKIMLKQKSKSLIKFPSLRALINYFDVSKDEVYKALNELKQTGFDYEILDKSHPILVWDNLVNHKKKIAH